MIRVFVSDSLGPPTWSALFSFLIGIVRLFLRFDNFDPDTTDKLVALVIEFAKSLRKPSFELFGSEMVRNRVFRRDGRGVESWRFHAFRG